MALIECPECVSEVSSLAPECPRCGCPLGRARRPNEIRPAARGHSATLVGEVVGRMALFGVLMASAITWEAPPVGLAAIVILGSIVPLWFKARREDALGDGGKLSRLRASLERVVDDLERRREADAELQARRIEELEDRLDFAERFLAQRREGEKDPAEQLLIPDPR